VLVHVLEHLGAAGRRVDDDDPAVGQVMPALDEPALLHAVDDARRAGHRDVERLRELAHRQGPIDLEHGQDVEIGSG